MRKPILPSMYADNRERPPPRAIEHDLFIFVGRELVDLQFQHSSGKMHGPGNHSRRQLVRLPHVDQQKVLSVLLHLLQVQ